MATFFTRKTVKISVAEHLLEAIGKRELQPGERIIEGKMALSLGVAKSTLREALQDLEYQGVLMKFENRGTYVTKLTTQNVQDIYNVRIKLEPEAAVLAHHHLTPKDDTQLLALLNEMRNAGEQKDYFNASKNDMAFHQLVWKLSGNLALEKALNAISTPMFAFTGLYLLGLFSHSASDYGRICDDHRAMLAALNEGPPEEVARIFVEKLGVFKSENLFGAQMLEASLGKQEPSPHTPLSLTGLELGDS